MNSQHVIPEHFYRRRFRDDVIVSSVCMFCGKCIGFSPTERMLNLLERCHRCSEGRAALAVVVTPSKHK